MRIRCQQCEYDVSNCEMLDTKANFGKWHHCLEGARVVALSLSAFFYYLQSGSKNCKADALSRIHDSPDLNSVMHSQEQKSPMFTL